MAIKYFEDQIDGEELLLLFRKHPVVMRKQLVVASVVILLGVLPSLVRPDFSLFFGGLGVGFLMAFAVMFYAWIGWHFSVYIVTDKRLLQVKQKGLFHRSVVDISNDQISMVNYEISGLQETLLGFGTIIVQTYVGELVIKDVEHPKKTHREITKALRAHGFLQGSGQPFGSSSTNETDEDEA